MHEQLTRRAILRAAGGLGLAAATGMAYASDDKKPAAPYFGGGSLELITPDSLKPKAYTSNISPDGLAFTIMFSSANVDALQVTLNGAQCMSAVKVAVLRIPFVLPAGKRLVGFVQDIRGYVSKTKGARISLVADLGGSTQVFDFPPSDNPSADNFTRSFISADRREATKDTPTLYTINFFLTAQCQAPEDNALLVVDSLDVEAVLYAPATAKRNQTPPKKRRQNP
jgi:hypothetical protein